jgi:acyl dehydratase
MATEHERYYEDLNVGDEFVSPARTITEADIVAFAGISGDFNPLHTDEERARTTMFGARIAHGLLGVAIASGLASHIKELHDDKFVAFLGLKWDFKKPVFIGDTLRLVETVAQKRETKRPDAGLVIFNMALLNQHDDRVHHGEFKLLLKKRPTGLYRGAN